MLSPLDHSLRSDPATLGWVRLARCAGLPPREALALGRTYGGAAFAEPGAIREAPRLPSAVAEALRDPALERLVKDEAERAASGGWTLLHPEHPQFPPGLSQLEVPPPLLGVVGEPGALAGPAVAIVGSRHPSGYGLRLADELGGGLASLGIVIVSGLAQGIDAAAHRAALGAGGRTVAVMGTGLDRVYPRHHSRLARAIADAGALVSEFPPGAEPQRNHFPRRNRIIAGLADAVVVVEARSRSGALITAQWATDTARPVLAVPGRAGEPLAEGPLRLLRDGAALACSVADVLLELPPDRRPEGLSAAAAAEHGQTQGPGDAASAELLALLPRDDEVHLDALLDAAGSPPEEVLHALFTLELAGLVESLPGRCYRRARRAGPGPPV